MNKLNLSGRLRFMSAGALLIGLNMAAGTAFAGEADVLKAVASEQGSGNWRFDVTIRSNDKGWDYYCDRFEIVGPAGKVLGTRILVHPHETEQPFTRSISSVKVPPGIDAVTVRAAMKPSGAGGETVSVRLR